MTAALTMRIAGIGIVLALQAAVAAQLAFDVASIKESQSLDAGGSLRLMPGGGITARHIPVRTLMTIAHQLQPFQVVDAPQWTRERYYDVTARPAGPATREQTFVMLQALLTERFKLAFHRENRQQDGFALVRAGTGPLGPGLRATSVDCGVRTTTAPQCRDGEITSSSMRAFGVPIWSVLQLVISEVGAPVSDDTGLDGNFDVTLRWSNDVAAATDLPSIFTALQEQLALKLERRRVTSEVLVIDRIERPTPD